MREGQPLGAELEIAEQEQVEIDRPRPMADAPGETPLRPLDRLADVEQGLGPDVGLHLHAGVEELALIEHLTHRLCLVHRGGRGHDDAVLRQGRDGGLEVAPAIAFVRAEAEVADRQASRQTSTDTSPTGRGSGGSGLAALTQTATAS